MDKLAGTPKGLRALANVYRAPSPARNYALVRQQAHQRGREIAREIAKESPANRAKTIANWQSPKDVNRQTHTPLTLARSDRSEARAVLEKTAMDTELAEAVFLRWQEGLPVYEATLYKAASVLGADPDAVLTEARFYTHLDRALERGTGFTAGEREYFSVAAGFNPFEMEKTAEAYGFESSDRLIMRALGRRHFQPDVEKLAMVGLAGGPQDDQSAMDPNALQDLMAQGGGQPAPPQAGAQLQQNPMVRPSPTAPPQVPSSPQGNLQDLLSQAGQTPGAPENGGLPPAGMGATGAPPEPPSTAERLQQAVPGIPPDALERYAPQLEQFEQSLGMTIMDPKQIEKFVKELQKTDKKVVDEAIKQWGEAQMQAQGFGSGPSGWDETAPKPNGGGGAGAGQAAPAAPPAQEGMPKQARLSLLRGR